MVQPITPKFNLFDFATIKPNQSNIPPKVPFTSTVAQGAITGKPVTSTVPPVSKTPIMQQVKQLKATEVKQPVTSSNIFIPQANAS
jgi:hypothetical protein